MAKKKEEAPAAASHSPAIHLPPPSYWPIVLAAGMLVLGIGIIYSLIVAGVGIVIMLAALVGWTGENRAIEAQEEHGHHE